jgi:hypothetical protein
VEGIVVRSETQVVPAQRLHQLRLVPDADPGDLEPRDGGITFTRRTLSEVLLTVEWTTTNTDGTRFAHTAIPDQHPLHSEAINAKVLALLSGGRQLLRGDTIFVPGEVDHISLEAWHDAPEPISGREATLEVRDLGGRTSE